MRTTLSVVTAILAAIGLTAAAAPASLAGQPYPGDTEIFTEVPQPGSPEGIAVHEGTVYVGTHTPVYGNALVGGPSHIFTYDLATGERLGEIVVEGQTTEETHGLLGMAVEDGDLFVLDRNPARVLRFDLDADPPTQTTYATFPDLAPCTPVTGPPCSPTTADQAAFPDGIVFGPDGDAYVTDLEQATIYRVPDGGGDAEIFYQDARFDSVFGPNGIDIGPDGQLYIAMTGSMQPGTITQGLVYQLPLDDPTSEDLEVFHTFPTPAAGPDGIRFGCSGFLYVALAGLSQVAALHPEGHEVFRFPGLVTNQMREVPFDMPASLAFDDADETLLITNQAFFTGNPEHWAVFESRIFDTELAPGCSAAGG